MQLQLATHLILIQAITAMATALRIAVIDVPSPVAAGDSVELTCSYDLEGDKLYSVKYYKDGYEFYRHVPTDWPVAQYFILPGIKVDIARSDQNRVYLKDVDVNSAGLYRCEISAEAPSFNTAAAEKEMQIYVLPTDRPVLRINKTQGRPGDQVYVSCISSKSKPAGTLGLFINGEPLVDENKKIEREVDANGLESTILRMAFVLTPEHFKYGSVKLKCISSMSDVYLMTHETIVEIYNQDEVEERARALASEQITDEGDIQATARSYGCSVIKGPRSHWYVLNATCILLLFLLKRVIMATDTFTIAACGS